MEPKQSSKSPRRAGKTPHQKRRFRRVCLRARKPHVTKSHSQFKAAPVAREICLLCSHQNIWEREKTFTLAIPPVVRFVLYQRNRLQTQKTFCENARRKTSLNQWRTATQRADSQKSKQDQWTFDWDAQRNRGEELLEKRNATKPKWRRLAKRHSRFKEAAPDRGEINLLWSLAENSRKRDKRHTCGKALYDKTFHKFAKSNVTAKRHSRMTRTWIWKYVHWTWHVAQLVERNGANR